jgi:hypothetical protein
MSIDQNGSTIRLQTWPYSRPPRHRCVCISPLLLSLSFFGVPCAGRARAAILTAPRYVMKTYHQIRSPVTVHGQKAPVTFFTALPRGVNGCDRR